MNVSNSIVDFFQGNPFNNPIGSYIEKATDSKNEVENWTLFMEICDIINSMEDGPRLAIRAIKRRLTTDIQNNTITVLYTLVLLEACVKNCGYRFHLVVCSRDFLQEFEKLALGTPASLKNDVPIIIRDRVLILIKTWFDTFKRQPDLKEIESTYLYLHECGLKFPEANLDTMSPIKTRKKSIQPSKSTTQEAQKGSSPPSMTTSVESELLTISDNVLVNLSKDLVTVRGNIDVLSELMTDYPPSEEIPDDVICLMKNLESISQQMQLRLVELINIWEIIDQKDGSALLDLLTVNDDMNNVLIQYERYERARTGQNIRDISKEELLNLPDSPSIQQSATEYHDNISNVKYSKSKDDKISSEVPHSSEEVENLISKEINTGLSKSSTTALSSQEFDQFLTERAQNSFSINGDYSEGAASSDRHRLFAAKPHDAGKDLLDS